MCCVPCTCKIAWLSFYIVGGGLVGQDSTGYRQGLAKADLERDVKFFLGFRGRGHGLFL